MEWLWLDAQGFQSQQMPTSLNVVFHQAADTLTVEVGSGKWIDKAAAGAVSVLPLAVTARIGAWKQSALPDKISEYINNRQVHR
jgi:hypothetical protein